MELLKRFFEGKSIAKSKEIPDKKIKRLRRLEFLVDKQEVDLGRESCSCEFFRQANTLDIKKAGVSIRCQHIFAAERLVSSQIGVMSR